MSRASLLSRVENFLVPNRPEPRYSDMPRQRPGRSEESSRRGSHDPSYTHAHSRFFRDSAVITQPRHGFGHRLELLNLGCKMRHRLAFELVTCCKTPAAAAHARSKNGQELSFALTDAFVRNKPSKSDLRLA